jgi:hypothetical protein
MADNDEAAQSRGGPIESLCASVSSNALMDDQMAALNIDLQAVSGRYADAAMRGLRIGFAGIVMVVLGSLDAFWGLAAILNNEVVVVGGHGALIFDLTTWGWVQLILGVLVGLTGIGLLVGNEVARVLGISLLAINAILQVVWFTAAPLWAFLMIILDVVIIYQLMVNWAGREA